ncbi:hypothetical protein [Bradyrhizobium sp. USDA 372]
MLINTVSGGAHSTTTTLKFETEAQCKAAFERLMVLPVTPVFDQSNKPVGIFRLSAQCIGDAK